MFVVLPPEMVQGNNDAAYYVQLVATQSRPCVKALHSPENRGESAPAIMRGNVALSSCPQKIALLAVYPERHLGDQSQSLAIARAIQAVLARAPLTLKPVEIVQAPLKASQTSSSEDQLRFLYRQWQSERDAGAFDQLIVVAAGAGIVSLLGEMSATPGFTTVYGTHQLSSEIRQAVRLPTVIALPSTAATPEEKASLASKTTWIAVQSVASMWTPKQFSEDAAVYRAKGFAPVPEVNGNTVGVILGGDAPDEQGRMRLFTADDARALARRILAVEMVGRMQCQFIVTNSPRTGKHAVDDAGLPFDPHQLGMLDPVTRAFVDELQHGSDCAISVFDFQQHVRPSAFSSIIDRFLKAGRNAGNVHVPGDSPSMIAETASLSKRVIDDLPSMNASHKSVVLETLKNEGGQRLDEHGMLTRFTPAYPLATETAADAIAARVVGIIFGTCLEPLGK